MSDSDQERDDERVDKTKKRGPPLSGVLPKYARVPISDLPLKNSGPRRSSSSRFSEKTREKLERLPAFDEVHESKKQELLKRKIKQCRVVFDFTNPISDAEGKELKREILKELVDFISNPENTKEPFAPEIYKEVFTMIDINLFRPLAPRVNPTGPAYDPEEDEPILEEAWPHLRIVYKFFLHFLESPAFDTRIAQTALDTTWIQKLLALFDSEDPRERDYLKTTLHRIYGRFLDFRAFIRQAICNIFYTFIYETERHNGIAELLEILGTIIHGFALPLKAEHKAFLRRALLPLHKPRCVGMYYPQLAYCIYQFLEKDAALTSVIFGSILRYWPVVNSPKEMMFLSEVEELLSIVPNNEMEKIASPLFKRLARCMSSNHFQVAEKALSFWRKKLFIKIARRHLTIVLPIVYGPLYTSSKNHWHRSVRVMSVNALRYLMEMNANLFAECTEQYRKDYARGKKHKEENDRKWEELETIVKLGEDDKPSPSPLVTKRARRKSVLPVDALTLEALQSHVGLDDSVGQDGGGGDSDDDERREGEEDSDEGEEEEEEDDDERQQDTDSDSESDYSDDEETP